MRIRTIQGIMEEIYKDDPHSAITEHYIRQLCINGEIPYRRSGSKYLIDYDNLKHFFERGDCDG